MARAVTRLAMGAGKRVGIVARLDKGTWRVSGAEAVGSTRGRSSMFSDDGGGEVTVGADGGGTVGAGKE